MKEEEICSPTTQGSRNITIGTYLYDETDRMVQGSNWWGQNIKPCVMMNYVHTDRLGSVVNLSDQYGRVTARANYDDWGKVTAYTDITVDGGFRRLLPEITYATHEYDDVLDMFYAKARMYDADNRRFAAVDPVKGSVIDPMSMVQYLYVQDNPVNYVDLKGMFVDKLQVWMQTGNWKKPEDLRGVPGEEWAYWDEILWDNYQKRTEELPYIQDDFTRALVYDEIIYEEAEKLQKEFAHLHLLRLPTNGAIYDTLDPLYTQFQRQDQKSRLVRAFTDGFEVGFQVGLGVSASSYYYDSKHYVKTGQDPWSKSNFKRGKIIDEALGNNLGENFPVVDKLENRVLTSIKSLDASAKSYQTATNIFDKLSCYIQDLADFTEKSWNGIVITKDSYDFKAIELAIPNRILSQAQMEGIINAIKDAAQKGIQFIIIVVE